MSDKRPFWSSPYYGTKSSIDWNDGDKTFSVITEYDDVQPLLDLNAEKRREQRVGYSKKGEQLPDMIPVASVPVAVQYEWLTKYGVELWREEDWPRVRKLLNSSDYRYLKTQDIIL